MTPPEINQTIAAHCGWKQDANGWWSHPTLPDNGGAMPEPPDYCGDLNACHEMEKKLRFIAGGWCEYWEHLETMTESRTFDKEIAEDCKSMLHATALQRSEAFLRAIGKWKQAPEHQIYE